MTLGGRTLTSKAAQSGQTQVLTPDWCAQPYWLDDAPDVVVPALDWPNEVDVLIIGAGYTGLNAAIETARAGRTTLVVDAGSPGAGCSTRNGGQISTSVKPSLAELTAKFGADRAQAIRGEGTAALQWIEARISAENIDCHFTASGRFHAAHNPKAYDELLRDVDVLAKEGIEVQPIGPGDQHAEIGSNLYSGGVVFPAHRSLHPAKYHRGLLVSALNAGAHVVGDCAALAIEPDGAGFEVLTEKGRVRAGKVVVATNGYTGPITPWLRRRVIPIGSYMIATEPLPKALMDRLMPKDRVYSDTRKVVYYYRPSPDRTRILFGGRVSANETNPAVSGPRLYEDMCRIFPEIHEYRISHAWMGTVAYSFDELAHIGVHDGIYFAMGYCGSGVQMASYLGMRIGQKLLGTPEGQTAFDDLPFPTRPFYRGKPWFLPPVVWWYRWRDRRQLDAAQRIG